MITIRLLVVAVITLLSVEASAQEIPTDEAAFTEFVAQAIRREVGDAPVAVKGPLTVSVGTLQANLGRIFGFCQANKAGCAIEVDKYAKGAAQILKQENIPLDKTAIRLVVRTTEYIKRAQASFGNDGPTLQSKPLAEGLVSVAVLDTPRAIRPLDDRDLKKLNISQDQLFELGSENLRSTLKPITDSAKPATAGQIGTITGSIYEVGRVTVLSQWADLANAQQGNLIVALPTTDRVLYISEVTPVALDALRTLSNNVASKAPNPLAPSTLLKWTSDRWVVVQ